MTLHLCSKNYDQIMLVAELWLKQTVLGQFLNCYHLGGLKIKIYEE